MDKPIYVTSPLLPPLEDFTSYLKEIWDSRILTNNGSFHKKLEEELAIYLKVPYLCLFTNGTLPLITALQAMRITGEVITTPFSFVATTHSLWWNGIKPVFVDIEPETCNIDPAKIEAAITPRTTAIMPVHVYGKPCKTKEIQEIADKYGLKVIYDAAHAFGVEIHGKSILNSGDMSTLSFHATKVFNTLEGGALVIHDEQTKKRIDYLKNFGFADETEIVHSQIIEKDGMKKVIVNFERPTENGFDSARCELPDYKWTERMGYSDEEIEMFEELLHSNAHLLYKYAENGGIQIA